MAGNDEIQAQVDELKRRVDELETRVQQSQQDAAAARVLAGGADRDVAEIRAEIRDFRQATIGTMNALRHDQADLRDEVRRGFTEVRGSLDGMAAVMAKVGDTLARLIDDRGSDDA